MLISACCQVCNAAAGNAPRFGNLGIGKGVGAGLGRGWGMREGHLGERDAEREGFEYLYIFLQGEGGRQERGRGLGISRSTASEIDSLPPSTAFTRGFGQCLCPLSLSDIPLSFFVSLSLSLSLSLSAYPSESQAS